MADASQPTTYDYASPNQWRINFDRLPLTTWFCTNANIPGITLGEAQVPTPMSDIPISGDKLTFDTLNIQFLVDEELKNYREMWEWLVGLGFPKQHSQFSDVLSESKLNTVLPGASRMTYSNKAGQKTTLTDGASYSDATMTFYNSKNIAKVEVHFRDIFPTSLSGIDLTTDTSDVEYIRVDASFRYLYYEFKNAT